MLPCSSGASLCSLTARTTRSFAYGLYSRVKAKPCGVCCALPWSPSRRQWKAGARRGLPTDGAPACDPPLVLQRSIRSFAPLQTRLGEPGLQAGLFDKAQIDRRADLGRAMIALKGAKGKRLMYREQ